MNEQEKDTTAPPESNDVTPTPPPQRKAGRPKGTTKKSAKISEDRVKEPVKTCPFIVTTKKNVPTEVADSGGTTTQPRMIEESNECGNPAKGENGFCFDHSWPIVQPIHKLITRKTSTFVDVNGKPTKVEGEEQVNVIFQRGEHLTREHFTRKEAQQYFESGHVDKRVDMTSTLSNKKPIDLDDLEITKLLLRPDEEQAALIQTKRFTESTLRKILVQTTSPAVESAINERL